MYNGRMSSYGGGFPKGLSVQNIPILNTYSGKVFWVDENGGGGSRGDVNHPVLSIDEAMALCVADRGDIIMVKPGHIENISAAGDLTLDVAGVSIVGLGSGDKQAKIVFDTADTADIDVSAANVTLGSMWIEANYANVDGAIDLAAGGDYFTIEGCRVTASAAATDFEEFLNVADGAHYFSFIGNDVFLLDGTDAECLVITAAATYGMRVTGNTIIMEASACVFDLDAAAMTTLGPVFRDNFMVNLTAAANYVIEIDSTTVAFFCNERYACAGADILVNDAAASHFAGCEGSDGVDQSSLPFPKTATAWP